MPPHSQLQPQESSSRAILPGIFGDRLTAIENFTRKLDENPYHPFTRLGPKKFYLRMRYRRFYVSLVTSFLSLVLVALFSALKEFSGFQFILSAALFVSSITVTYTYKDTREYTLDGENCTYSFKVGKNTSYTGPYHNVYIRLRKRIDSGKARYYLIFNGYQMDKQVLTGTTRNSPGLRQLGQQLAHALAINYFDEPNVSPHHVLRHDRPHDVKLKRGTEFV
eukprot:TRINITY_DN877_c0_g1_i2.p1 TRINITY_DN877_c0_g1~~TRINITY_DN877_c0_g1_i2.p1  ORF type:complete len:222 (-),score=22.06 TRINITY_DN877_c0_g1_i2:103-768(-)